MHTARRADPWPGAPSFPYMTPAYATQPAKQRRPLPAPRRARAAQRRTCDRAVRLGGQEALGADRGQRQHARERRLRALAVRQRQRTRRLARARELERLLRHIAQHLTGAARSARAPYPHPHSRSITGCAAAGSASACGYGGMASSPQRPLRAHNTRATDGALEAPRVRTAPVVPRRSPRTPLRRICLGLGL